MKKIAFLFVLLSTLFAGSFWNACTTKPEHKSEKENQESFVSQREVSSPDTSSHEVFKEKSIVDKRPKSVPSLQEIIETLQKEVSQKCVTDDGRWMSSDPYKGRNNSTQESTEVQKNLIDAIKKMGLLPVGKDYTHAFQGKAPGRNVIAQWKGSDPKRAKEIVVVGAHFDHLGMRKDGKIFRGASDNALGVAVVLEIARVLTSQKFHPARTVIFAFWDSEEDGLQGSTLGLSANQIPLERVVAYLNVDIAGANLFKGGHDIHFVLGGESGGAPLQAIIKRQTQKSFANMKPVPLAIIFGQARSDHVPFLNNEIPSLFFTDSTNKFYHTVNDMMANANLAKAADTARLMLGVLLEITEMKKTLEWNIDRYRGNVLAAFGLVDDDLRVLLALSKRVLDNRVQIGLTATELNKLKASSQKIQTILDSGKIAQENPIQLLLKTVAPLISMLAKHDPGH